MQSSTLHRFSARRIFLSHSDGRETHINLVPCTLYTGHYHLGVGALANSLYRNGFRGTFWVGYRPPLPEWAAPVERDGDDTERFVVASDFSITFVRWQSQRNISLEKARFLIHVLDRMAPAADAALLFDADVVVKGSRGFFERWLAQGIALCLDLTYPLVSALHPWRETWRALAAERGRHCRDLEYYVNSGFVGVPRAHRAVAEIWAEMIDDYVAQRSAMPDKVKFAGREEAFVGDQDMLNAAIMATSAPLSIIGQEAMDFAPAGFIMSHAVDAEKPWQKRYVRSALAGHPPGAADKTYWQFADAPIPLFAGAHIARTRAALKVASLIGRFYARNVDTG